MYWPSFGAVALITWLAIVTQHAVHVRGNPDILQVRQANIVPLVQTQKVDSPYVPQQQQPQVQSPFGPQKHQSQYQSPYVPQQPPPQYQLPQYQPQIVPPQQQPQVQSPKLSAPVAPTSNSLQPPSVVPEVPSTLPAYPPNNYIFRIGQKVTSLDGKKSVTITRHITQTDKMYAGFARYNDVEHFFKCSCESWSYQREFNAFDELNKHIGSAVVGQNSPVGHLSLMLDQFTYIHKGNPAKPVYYECFIQKKIEGVTLGVYLQGQLNNLRDITKFAQLVTLLLAQTMETLEAMHLLGVYHCDLKPENIMVTTVNGKPYIIVIDYDLSVTKRWGPSYTTGGTVGFFPPEQFLAKRQDFAKMDVWSAGMSFIDAIQGYPIYCYNPKSKRYSNYDDCKSIMKDIGDRSNWRISAIKDAVPTVQQIAKHVPVLAKMVFFTPWWRPTPKQVLGALNKQVNPSWFRRTFRRVQPLDSTTNSWLPEAHWMFLKNNGMLR